MTSSLVLSHSVMLVGLKEISYCPVLRIQRQFGESQRALNKDHMGYICPLRGRVIERIREAWPQRARTYSITAPELISPLASYYAWLASDIEESKKTNEQRKRKRLGQNSHE